MASIDLVNEASINLERVRSKMTQISQGGLAGSKVVQGNLNPEFLEALQRQACSVDVV